MIADCPLLDLAKDDATAAELAAGAKALGASAMGIVYYDSDWPEQPNHDKL